MTLSIYFSPQEEAWLNYQAVQQGIPPAEIIRRLVDERMPELAKRTASAPVAPIVDAENAAAIAYLERKLNRDATDDPEEIRKAEEEWEELKRNLNANRAEIGERLVFP